MEIRFSSIEQAKAVRDVIQHRLWLIPKDVRGVPDLELDEGMELAAFHYRLKALIKRHHRK